MYFCKRIQDNKDMTDNRLKDLLREALREHDKEKATENDWLSMQEVCELLHIRRCAVYDRIKNTNNRYGQKLPYHKAGRRLLFRRSDVLKFVN